MIKKIILFIAIFALSYLIINAFYTFPSADDFSYFVKQNKYGFWEFQKWHYLNWGGRYIPNAVLGSFSFDGNGLYLYRMVAVIVIITLALAFYQFSHTFFDKKSSFYVASLLFLTYCFSLYSIAQEFYWMPGSITYTLGITLSLFIWSLLKNVGHNFHFLLSILGVIILNGTNEVSMVFFNGSLVLFLIFKLLNTEKISKRIYLITGISIIFMLISILAPGNSVRTLSENNANTHQLFFALPRSIYRAFTFMYEKFFIFLLLGIIIFNRSNLNGLKLKIAEKFPLTIKFLIFIFPFAILVSGVGLSYYATGRIPPERTVNAIAFYFLIAIIFSVLFFKTNFIKDKKIISKKRDFILGILTIVLIAIIPNELRKNAEDLFSGRSHKFSIEMNERDALLKKPSEKDIKLKKISHLPKSIFFKDISSNPNNFFNKYYAQFYRKTSVIINE